MSRAELFDCIVNGENARVAFKRDDCQPDELATEMSALLNLAGGIIVLGVDDDGRSSDLTRRCRDAEECVTNIARQDVHPAIVLSWSCVVMDCGKGVGVIEIPADSPGKPYKARTRNAWVTFVRVGSTSREATREERGSALPSGQAGSTRDQGCAGHWAGRFKHGPR